MSRKKIIIAIFLFIASILAIILLGNSSNQDRLKLNELVRIDSLILQELNSFNIQKKHITSKKITVNHFSRIHYTVKVPRQLSKTLVQTDLHYRFYPMDVQVPAKVVLPERDLLIYFYTAGTVIRSIELKTDTSFAVNTYSGSLFFVMDESVSTDIIEQANDLGENAAILYRSLNPSTVQKWVKKQDGIMKSMYLWLNEQGGDELVINPIWLTDKLPQFASISSKMQLLIDKESKSKDQKVKDLFLNYSVKEFPYSKVVFIDSEKGIFETQQQLQLFKQWAKEGKSPYLWIKLNSKTLELFKNESFELKKRGIRFVNPDFN